MLLKFMFFLVLILAGEDQAAAQDTGALSEAKDTRQTELGMNLICALQCSTCALRVVHYALCAMLVPKGA